jgi:sugar phosphate permease
VAVLVAWRIAFQVSAGSLLLMGTMCLISFTLMEKKGIIHSGHIIRAKAKGGKIKVLLERQILKFTVIAIITGVVRTAVVFWLPTYLKQHLQFSTDNATMLFTLCTSILSVTSFITVFTYEALKRNMNLAILIYFSVSASAFVLLLFVTNPILNIVVMLFAIMACQCADSLMWSRYCPSLYDTGLTSTATGYLDFLSYMAAATASSIFPRAKDYIGWEGLILVWCSLMIVGVLISLRQNKKV